MAHELYNRGLVCSIEIIVLVCREDKGAEERDVTFTNDLNLLKADSGEPSFFSRDADIRAPLVIFHRDHENQAKGRSQ